MLGRKGQPGRVEGVPTGGWGGRKFSSAADGVGAHLGCLPLLSPSSSCPFLLPFRGFVCPRVVNLCAELRVGARLPNRAQQTAGVGHARGGTPSSSFTLLRPTTIKIDSGTTPPGVLTPHPSRRATSATGAVSATAVAGLTYTRTRPGTPGNKSDHAVTATRTYSGWVHTQPQPARHAQTGVRRRRRTPAHPVSHS